jgi:hypothetical protein
LPAESRYTLEYSTKKDKNKNALMCEGIEKQTLQTELPPPAATIPAAMPMVMPRRIYYDPGRSYIHYSTRGDEATMNDHDAPT